MLGCIPQCIFSGDGSSESCFYKMIAIKIPVPGPVVFRSLALALALFATRAAGLADPAASSAHPDFEVKVTGQGRPVVFIPGLASPGDIWQPVVERLQATCQCHVLSLAGFGGMKPTGTDPFLPRVRDEIIAYLRAQKLDHPLIVGHSLGGTVALWLAETAPEVPGGLVIVDALPFQAAILNPTATEESARAQIAPRVAFYSRATPAEVADYQQTMVPQWVSSPEQAKAIAARNGLSDPKTLARALGEVVSLDLRADLGKIHCPVLVLGALADKVAFASRDQVINAFHKQYAALNGVRFMMFEHSRHYVMVDDPEGFLRAVTGELDSGW